MNSRINKFDECIIREFIKSTCHFDVERFASRALDSITPSKRHLCRVFINDVNKLANVEFAKSFKLRYVYSLS